MWLPGFLSLGRPFPAEPPGQPVAESRLAIAVLACLEGPWVLAHLIGNAAHDNSAANLKYECSHSLCKAYHKYLTSIKYVIAGQFGRGDTMKRFLNHFLRKRFSKPQKKILTIEVTSACNVKCVWCFMQTFNKIEKGFMSVEEFNNIILNNLHYIKQNFVIAPYFRGEPLLHPGFWEICGILKKYNIENTGIHSNFSIKIDIDKIIEYNIPICVNIGGITKGDLEKLGVLVVCLPARSVKL